MGGSAEYAPCGDRVGRPQEPWQPSPGPRCWCDGTSGASPSREQRQQRDQAGGVADGAAASVETRRLGFTERCEQVVGFAQTRGQAARVGLELAVPAAVREDDVAGACMEGDPARETIQRSTHGDTTAKRAGPTALHGKYDLPFAVVLRHAGVVQRPIDADAADHATLEDGVGRLGGAADRLGATLAGDATTRRGDTRRLPDDGRDDERERCTEHTSLYHRELTGVARAETQ
jgi:hypothetical protein